MTVLDVQKKYYAELRAHGDDTLWQAIVVAAPAMHKYLSARLDVLRYLRDEELVGIRSPEVIEARQLLALMEPITVVADMIAGQIDDEDEEFDEDYEFDQNNDGCNGCGECDG